ncbi:MAG: right-handed parallel beta-helix repeat-containing protein [Planctomycetes bacterium]|nr:right-handed parallel beta-helix repeat-containing protein [Planctomycetota bacterium]
MNARSCIRVLASMVVVVGGAHAQQLIHVDTSADVIDFGGARQVDDLPGPDGKVSLAEAGLASDNTPGVQTIGFQVPHSEWLYQWLFPGRVVLRPFLGFRTFDTVILDATTQTAFTGDTNPAGGEVVIWQQTYLVDNVGSVMRGFDNSPVSVSGGSANVIQGNTQTNIDVYDSPFTVVGGANPGEGNTGGTIKIDRSSDNVVIGNTVQRVRVLGWIAGGQPAANVRVGGPTLGERNHLTGYGTWTSEGYPGGTTLQVFDTVGLLVENNWIGTTPDGMAQGSQASTQGIGFEGENYGALIRDNRIAGILGHGIGPHYAGWLVGSAVDIYGTGNGITLVGNTIGLNANDEPVLGSITGIALRDYYLGPVQNVVIGGTNPGEGNVIAGHSSPGISVAGSYSGVRIHGNSIHENGALGIDLVDASYTTGVTPNDLLDLDQGGNGLQNFPVLQAVTTSGTMVRAQGLLQSTPAASFTLDFFASAAADPSGFGEGEQVLGSSSVTTDAAGNGAFDVSLAAAMPAGWSVTATATAADGSTSEFGKAVSASSCSLATYCTAKVNSLGCTPLIAANGSSSASSPSGFVIDCVGVRNQKLGLLFYGVNGPAAAPFQGGTLCVAAPIKRTPLVDSGGSASPANDCTGRFAIDMNAFAAGSLGGAPLPELSVVGTVVHTQWWGRDPGFSPPHNTTLSAGQSYTVCD